MVRSDANPGYEARLDLWMGFQPLQLQCVFNGTLPSRDKFQPCSNKKGGRDWSAGPSPQSFYPGRMAKTMLGRMGSYWFQIHPKKRDRGIPPTGCWIDEFAIAPIVITSIYNHPTDGGTKASNPFGSKPLPHGLRDQRSEQIACCQGIIYNQWQVVAMAANCSKSGNIETWVANRLYSTWMTLVFWSMAASKLKGSSPSQQIWPQYPIF